MVMKSGLKTVLWMIPGAAFMIAFVLIAAHFY